jgi:hypothetical protein
MTADEFRKIALDLPDAVEVGHMDHPDFRVRGKVFATLGYPNDEWAMVKLAADEQLALCAAKPKVFVPVKGAWGARGATNVRLDRADVADVREALALAHATLLAKQRSGRR